AGDQRAERGEVAAVEGKVDDLFFADDDAQRGVRRLDQRGLADDGDVLRHRPPLHGQIDARGLRDAHADVRAGDRVEPGEGGLHLVLPGREQGQGVEAFARRRGRTELARALVLRGHGDARQYRPRGIGDYTRDRPRGL